MNDFGKFLVRQNVITEFELVRALRLQEQVAVSLPRVLLAEGYLNYFQLYNKLAEFEGVAFIDLIKNPPAQDLLKEIPREEYLKHSMLPVKVENGITFIATTEITKDVKEIAERDFQKHHQLVMTSPYDIYHTVHHVFGETYDEEARLLLWSKQPEFSSRNLAKSWPARLSIFIVVTALVTIAVFFEQTYLYIFITANLFYISTLLFKTLLSHMGFCIAKATRSHSATASTESISDKDLPIYTILVPLYMEQKTLPQLIQAIRDLDYPMTKLDIKLIVEESDIETIEAIKALECERTFEIVYVPYSTPQTKPKACNYALRFAKGEYVTIYDAEDIPDPDQLKKVLELFSKSPETVKCIQAKLNYYNAKENLLTRFFALEYSNLFDFMLPGLDAMGTPIPLGGTSNHFKKQALDELLAWDPFNVTEDADLGIRMAHRGWQVRLIDSNTMEEAPVTIKAWIKQRTRWIKGHMQTYLVHMRNPLLMWKTIGTKGFMAVNFFLGIPIVIFLFSPVLWLMWLAIVTGLLTIPEVHTTTLYYDLMMGSGALILCLWLITQVYFARLSIKYRQWDGMTNAMLLFPFYWILHSVASFRALWQLITCPSYWEKTTHGVSSLPHNRAPAMKSAAHEENTSSI